MAETVDVVEFSLGSERYALDISLVREIVEMMPITPIPRAPAHITGVINLRGEITNIMNLYTLLGLSDTISDSAKKIIVFMPEAAGGNNVGVIVDNVMSVTPVNNDQVERNTTDSAGGQAQYIKGIIKTRDEQGSGSGTHLVLWLDMAKVLSDVAKK
jgi:purine-binding chemotaxis protein CheW